MEVILTCSSRRALAEMETNVEDEGPVDEQQVTEPTQVEAAAEGPPATPAAEAPGS